MSSPPPNDVLRFLTAPEFQPEVLRIVGRAHRRIADFLEFDDFYHEVVHRALSRQNSFRGDSVVVFFAWLRAIANHTAIDELREFMRRPPPASLDVDVPGRDPGGELPTVAADLVEALLKRLSPFEAALLRARYFGGLSFAQIAIILNESPDTIRQIHHRLMQRLREEFPPGA